MTVPVLSVVGRTNSGKTTLLERLIPVLKKRGYRVAAIKHDVHGFEMDHAGKDTWRMTRAGADAVVIASPEKMALVRKLEKELEIDEIVAGLLSDADIVITEGYKRGDKPKIEVSQGGELLCADSDHLLALISNPGADGKGVAAPQGLSVPVFGMDETERLADYLEEKLVMQKGRSA